jgi:hypothetical protein
MLVKILGILDIFIGICFFIFSFFGLIPSGFIFTLGVILLIKGIIFAFSLDISSILDIIAALIILIGLGKTPVIIVMLIVIFLLQKGGFSLMDQG